MRLNLTFIVVCIYYLFMYVAPKIWDDIFLRGVQQNALTKLFIIHKWKYEQFSHHISNKCLIAIIIIKSNYHYHNNVMHSIAKNKQNKLYICFMYNYVDSMQQCVCVS